MGAAAQSAHAVPGSTTVVVDPAYLYNRLQSVLNAAARSIAGL